MIWFMLSIGLIVGVVVGRWYQKAKQRYPEYMAAIHVKEAKLRAERAKYEAEEQRYRSEIDRSLESRTR